MKSWSFLCAIVFIAGNINAQITFPVNGVKDEREGLYAFTKATIYTHYNQKIEDATMVIRNGKIEGVGQNISIPKGAVIKEMQGKTIYPSFIDLDSNYGLKEIKPAANSMRSRPPQMISNKKGPYNWNEAMKTEYRACNEFNVNDKAAVELRKIGFGTVLTHRKDGISRGTGCLVTLGSKREHQEIIIENASHHMSFRKGTSTQNYPSSLMGAIALLRQTYLDGRWYATTGRKEEVNLSLEAWNNVQDLIQIFETGNRLEILRAAKIGAEFSTRYIIRGKGDEYMRLAAIKNAADGIIIPVSFPEAFDVEDPYDALMVSYSELKHWELAPGNAAAIAKTDTPFALTVSGLKKKGDFLKGVIKAIKYGLSEEDALKALTFSPAKMIRSEAYVGSLEKGKLANFIITSGNIFNEETKIFENWVRGKVYVIEDAEKVDVTGNYQLKAGGAIFQLESEEKKGKTSMKIRVNDTTTLKVSHSLAGELISISFSPKKGSKEIYSLSGNVKQGKWKGKGTDSNGNWFNWSAEQLSEEKPKKDDAKKSVSKAKDEENIVGNIVFPFVAYGNEIIPRPGIHLFKNATVWTNEEGILNNTDVLVQNGKIQQIGRSIDNRSAVVIDATGKHLTPGIVDEHSHIAISRGVNEGTQASSAEVRIGDVINSEDVNIYRQLSGGVTTAQLLHGSANPIGGQSGIIKMKWGYLPEDMKIDGADGFIKFALGENVKQSNWSTQYRMRFPQTRMGVEQLFDDHFTRANHYAGVIAAGKPYRKDLEMEALREILHSERFITCHSYQQGEINMLMKIAEKHAFRINTFTHILEGYKVADKMKEHGAGGSSFSDWWAYKFEVIDAIPHNGALMHEQGVVTAFNSDDAEMARRLNQEAAKAVKYGGVSEEDALKFVTLNPAKLLHIDDRTGSIRVGKDADLVLWSEHPLSVYAKAEITLVDGIKFFDREEDLNAREQIKQERHRIIQKMIAHKKNGGKTRPVKEKKNHYYHCDDVEDEMH